MNRLLPLLACCLVLASFANTGNAATESDGTTALHRAVHTGDVELATRLVREGADVNVANRYGTTALSLASVNGNGAIVALLLSAGADANAALPGGETPLMTASRTGSLAVVKALLVAGADIDAREEARGQTALMWAAAEGNADVVAALIAHGADLRERLESGFTPFLFACRNGRTEVVQALLKAGAEVNESIVPAEGARRIGGAPRPGTSALHLAVGNAHYELAVLLLEAGANPNADANGWTPLHSITGVRKPGGGDNNPAPYGTGSMSSLDMVRALKKHGANLDARMSKRINVGLTKLNTLGATPFLLAARSADAPLMRLLAELGADPLLPNADNSTPLMVAAGLGTRSPGEDAGTEAEVVEAIDVAVALGNHLDAVDSNGETAMHGAAYKNLPGAVEALMRHGANVAVWNANNRFGWTPLRIAQGYRFGNYKPSVVTVAVIEEALRKAGATATESTGRGRSDYEAP
ncbi:MAG: ankyrin repeat domain-containing protein [Bryobacterales bacterium]|nr:ankyrin repeat domain-containing protein [Bryobacterales bacterium]